MNIGLDTKTIVDITKVASQFKSSIVIRVNNKHIDVKSILGLSITLLMNDQFVLEIHGPDEEEARTEMIRVFEKHELQVKVI